MEFLARNGKDEATPGADHAAHLGEDGFDFGNVLEDRIRKNDIEGLVRLGNGVSRSTMDGGVDPAPAGNLGVRRIDLEPDQSARFLSAKDHAGKRSVAATEIENAPAERNVAQDRFDFIHPPEHGGGLKQVSRGDPLENVRSFGGEDRLAHSSWFNSQSGHQE